MGAVGAALAAGWLQREGVKISARAEHRRQQQDARRSVYKEFIAATDAVAVKVAIPLHRDSIPVILFTVEYMEELSGLLERLRAAWLEVVLTGPKALLEIATEIRDSANRIQGCSLIFSAIRAAREHDPVDWPVPPDRQVEQFKRGMVEIPADVQRFALAAQDALDDAGIN